MKRYRVAYRPDAIQDIAAIRRWIRENSRDAALARRFADRIFQACEKIGSIPFGGVARDDLSEGLRAFPFERSGIITYVVETQTVRIVNDFYGGRDYDSFYRESDD